MKPEVIRHIDQLGALGSEPDDGERRLVLVADAPRGLDLDQLGDLVRRLLGTQIPLVYLHYPRRQQAIADATAGRAFKPVDTVQLWYAMAGVVTSEFGSPVSEPVTLATPEESSAKGHLLVAEDDNINAKLINSLLRSAGCDVTLVRDGQAALDAAISQTFDLAFVDLRMPVMDGIGFTKAYRAQEVAGRHLPIVAITANAAEEARADCLRAGMDEFVTKPIDPGVLQELLQRYGIVCESS